MDIQIFRYQYWIVWPEPVRDGSRILEQRIGLNSFSNSGFVTDSPNVTSSYFITYQYWVMYTYVHSMFTSLQILLTPKLVWYGHSWIRFRIANIERKTHRLDLASNPQPPVKLLLVWTFFVWIVVSHITFSFHDTIAYNIGSVVQGDTFVLLTRKTTSCHFWP